MVIEHGRIGRWYSAGPIVEKRGDPVPKRASGSKPDPPSMRWSCSILLGTTATENRRPRDGHGRHLDCKRWEAHETRGGCPPGGRGLAGSADVGRRPSGSKLTGPGPGARLRFVGPRRHPHARLPARLRPRTGLYPVTPPVSVKHLSDEGVVSRSSRTCATGRASVAPSGGRGAAPG